MRSAGILLPISSLPSPYGVGTLGKEAYRFIDFLAAAGQSQWQILPIGPTGYGDSPYQSFSAFAGNPYFIDLDLLMQNKLLLASEIETSRQNTPHYIDYSFLFNTRLALLEKACNRQDKNDADYLNFCEKQKSWLPDYALFMAIKEAYNQASFEQWPEHFRNRTAAGMRLAATKWSSRISFWQCVQYFFFKQWTPLKRYANSRGVEIIGDIPIYVSADSCDLWANPKLFVLNQKNRPSVVAGVPPDAFSSTGQLWGNPLYHWKHHQRTRYAWWLSRIRHASTLFDVTRIDHFRGFESYYAVPAGSTTAIEGTWYPGPGKHFIKAIHRVLPTVKIIAEDLGFLTPEVHELLRFSGYPGMKVLQFAFDSEGESDYLPHNFHTNHTAVYTGTHDNTTTEDWTQSASPADVAFARNYLNLTSRQNLCDGMIYAAFSSVADMAIIPFQDWLRLGADSRINHPSTLGGINWQWRMNKQQLTPKLAKRIREKTILYGRLSSVETAKIKFYSKQCAVNSPEISTK